MITKYVDNIKCNGCATRIKNKLASIEGVSNISIDVENDAITAEVESQEVEERLSTLLAGMGYPQKGTSTAIQTAKSYVSCMIGRMQAE